MEDAASQMNTYQNILNSQNNKNELNPPNKYNNCKKEKYK